MLNHQRCVELMRAIGDEARPPGSVRGFDPNVTIEYQPAEGLNSGRAFKVSLAVKAYRRHDRMRTFWAASPGEALERALLELRQVRIAEEGRRR